MKRILLISILIAILIVCFPIANASSISGTTAVASSGQDLTVVDCSDQTENDFNAIAEEERSLWSVAMPIVMILIAIFVIYFCPICAASGGSIFGTTGTVASLGLTTSLQTALVGVSGIASFAYGVTDIFDSLDASRTVVFTATCDDDIDITLREDDGDCTCTIVDSSTSTSQNLGNGATYSVTSGSTYTMTAVLKDFNWPSTSATCKCTAKGYISSNNADPTVTQPTATLPTPTTPLTTTASSVLVCCESVDGVCLDNYIEGDCTSSGGTVHCISCSQVSACQPADGTGQGTASVSSTFASQGETVTISYYLSDATSSTTVKAIIKDSITTITTLQLYDDGSHSDGSASDKTYANTWTIPSSVTGDITWDIEIDYGTNVVTNQNVGNLLVTNAQCQPLIWNNGTTNIVIAGVNYPSFSDFSQDANTTWALIAMNQPFSTNMNDINFFVLDSMFSDTTNIISYANSNCFRNPNLIVAIDESASYCSQSGKLVSLNPTFSLNAGTELSTSISDFCSNVNDLSLLNPPIPTILNADATTQSSSFTFYYRINDEEEGVTYQLLQDNSVIESGTYIGSTMNPPPVRSRIISLPTTKDYNFQIKATDAQGIVGLSNTLVITRE